MDGATHEQHLATRRQKDRERYASMSSEQRESYNCKRREQYHRQSETSRKKRRERERIRYHSLNDNKAKERNIRRASLERMRYKRLSGEELASRNARRRSRAAALRAQKKAVTAAADQEVEHNSMGMGHVVTTHGHTSHMEVTGSAMLQQQPYPTQMQEGIQDGMAEVEMLSQQHGAVHVELPPVSVAVNGMNVENGVPVSMGVGGAAEDGVGHVRLQPGSEDAEEHDPVEV